MAASSIRSTHGDGSMVEVVGQVGEPNAERFACLLGQLEGESPLGGRV